VINGRSGVLFDGADDHLSATIPTTLGLGGNSSKTLIVVTRPLDLQGAPLFIFYHHGEMTSGKTFGASYNDGKLKVFQWGAENDMLGDSGPTEGATTVNTVLKSGDELSLYLDGSLAGGPTVRPAANVTSEAVTLGSRIDGLIPYDGYIAEVLLYSTALPEAERREIEDCLRLKWANVPLPTPTPTP
jgi:hypothetical protein